MKKYKVKLTVEEVDKLSKIVTTGFRKSYERNHAQILLLSDEGELGKCYTDSKISDILNINVRTVERIRYKFVTEGLDIALMRAKPSRTKTKILDGYREAQLLALACSEAPEGRAYWTLSLLAEKLIELEYVEKISKETVRRTLKKRN